MGRKKRANTLAHRKMGVGRSVEIGNVEKCDILRKRSRASVAMGVEACSGER